MASSDTSTAPCPPGTFTHRLSAKPTFCSGSWARDGTSSGRIPASSVRSATRAARLADRTDTNVATASTNVPTAVASEAAVAQSIAPSCPNPREGEEPNRSGGPDGPVLRLPHRPADLGGEVGFEGGPGHAVVAGGGGHGGGHGHRR